MDSPSLTTTYSLTISAPEDDDWLMALPLTPPTSPGKSRSPSPPSADNGSGDIGCSSVTVGDHAPNTWDVFRSLSPPPKKRKVTSNVRKPRTKNADSAAAKITNLVSLLHSRGGPGGVEGGGGGGGAGGAAPSVKNSSENHRPIDMRVIANLLSSVAEARASQPPPAAATPTTATPSSSSSLEKPESNAKLPPILAHGGRDPLPTPALVTAVDAAMETTSELASAKAGVKSGQEDGAESADKASARPVIAQAPTPEVVPQEGKDGKLSEDDILKSAMSATLFASAPSQGAASANIITALTSTDFTNLVWTPNSAVSSCGDGGRVNSDLSSLASDQQAADASGRQEEVGVASKCVGVTGAPEDPLPNASAGGGAGLPLASSGDPGRAATEQTGQTGLTGQTTATPAPTLTPEQLSAVLSALPPTADHTPKTVAVPTPILATNTPSSSSLATPTATPTSSDAAGPLLTLVSINSTLYLCNLNTDSPSGTFQAIPVTSQGVFPNASAIRNFRIPKKGSTPSPSKQSADHTPSAASAAATPSSEQASGPRRLVSRRGGRNPAGKRMRGGAHVRSGRTGGGGGGGGGVSSLLLSADAQARLSEEVVQGSVCLRRKRCGLATVSHALSFCISTESGRKWSSQDLQGEGAGPGVGGVSGIEW